MKALFEKGIISLYTNKKRTDLEKTNKMLKMLEAEGYAVGEEVDQEGYPLCYVICSHRMTIEEMKEDYSYFKTLL